MSDTKRKWRVSRRGFLIGLGATGATVALGVRLGLPVARLQFASFLDGASPPSSASWPPTAWFEITADNQVRLYVPKIEMGQGIHTALAQIGAEELEIEWEQLEVIQATTSRGLMGSMGTGASNSVSSLYTPLREAAATMREMMRLEAARQLGVTADSLDVAKGLFFVKDNPQQKIAYGTLTQYAQTWEVPEEAPPLKSRSSFRYIGKPIQRVDFTKKLIGEAIYGYDVRLPNMAYGAVARPPVLNASMKSAEVGNALTKQGVITAVIDNNFAGVVAESRQQAYAGVRDMSIEWKEGDRWQQADLESMVTVGKGTGVVIQKEGDAEANLKSNQIISAEYRTPFAAHAHLEPQAALVDVKPNQVQAWVATQSPIAVRREIAEVLGRDEESVEVIPTYLGGGFGRRLNVKVATEAARLSAAAGRPVHVGWNRTEEFRYGYFRPPTHHVLRASLDNNGRIHALDHEQASGDVAFAQFPSSVAAIMGADFGAWRGAMIQYGIPHRRTVAWRTKLPIATSWWRGLGLLANTFAVESFLDEIAHTANLDPLALRLTHLPEGELGERYKNVLERVAELSGWGTALPEGRAQGIACSVDVKTVVAQVAEVSIENGHIHVHKVDCVMDPGLVINPDGAIAQTQGSIIMGLSSTFFEEITIKNGMVEAANFDRYPLLTIKETPEMQVSLLESGEEPFGVGEPPIGPIAAAVANAVFALTGQRLRRLPLLRDELI